MNRIVHAMGIGQWARARDNELVITDHMQHFLWAEINFVGTFANTILLFIVIEYEELYMQAMQNYGPANSTQLGRKI